MVWIRISSLPIAPFPTLLLPIPATLSGFPGLNNRCHLLCLSDKASIFPAPFGLGLALLLEATPLLPSGASCSMWQDPSLLHWLPTTSSPKPQSARLSSHAQLFLGWEKFPGSSEGWWLVQQTGQHKLSPLCCSCKKTDKLWAGKSHRSAASPSIFPTLIFCHVNPPRHTLLFLWITWKPSSVKTSLKLLFLKETHQRD